MIPFLLLFLLISPVEAWLSSWSPEGDRFVYGWGGIFVVNPYTEEITHIHSGETPQWHPSRDLILFTHRDSVFTIHPDGTGKQKVGNGWVVGWSPDGTRYAYWGLGETDHIHQGETYRITVPVIWIGELDGDEKVIEIFLGERHLNVLSWGEYGISVTNVAGWAIRSFHEQWVTIIDPDTGETVRPPSTLRCPTRRTTTTIRSSNPDRVACIYLEQGPLDPGPPADWVPEQRFYLYQEVEEIDIGENLDVSGASWSPDGKFLVFDGLLDNDNRDVREIFYIEGDNPKEIKQLTFDGRWSVYPEWSPAGDLIIYRQGEIANDFDDVRFLKWGTSTGIRPVSWGELKVFERMKP